MRVLVVWLLVLAVILFLFSCDGGKYGKGILTVKPAMKTATIPGMPEG